jgi:hypothetical protein
MDRRISAKYFTIIDNEVGPSFEEILQNVSSIEVCADRERTLEGDVTIRLEHLEERGDLFVGDLTRIQSDNLPGFPDNDSINPLRDDKLGHCFAFSYHHETRTLCLQNLQSAQIGKVMQYFSIFNLESFFAQSPVLNQDMVDMLEDRTIVKLDVKIENIGRFIEATDNNESVAVRMARAARAVETKSLSFVMTAQRGDELDGAMVRRVAQESLTASLLNRSVKRIRVHTREDVNPLDFMGGHLLDRETLDLPSNNPLGSRQIRTERLRSWHLGRLVYLRQYVEDN